MVRSRTSDCRKMSGKRRCSESNKTQLQWKLEARVDKACVLARDSRWGAWWALPDYELAVDNLHPQIETCAIALSS